MKNGKVLILNGQPKTLPVSLVDGAWVGYVSEDTESVSNNITTEANEPIITEESYNLVYE